MRTITSWCLTAVLAIAILAPSTWAARFRVVALPDSQNYSEYHPGIFTSQTNWIKANVSTQSIVFVTHLGDIVNDGWNDTQWNNARTSMNVLKGYVPFGLCPGNHDLKSAADVYESTKFVTNFGPSYFSGYSWYGGASPSGFSSYQIVTAGGYDLLFLHLECDVPDTEISWAKSVLSSHIGIPTIVTTHEYLNSSQRDRTCTVPGSDRNSGEALWNKLIRQYDQIFCVLCGHVFSPDGWHRQISINNAGRKVYEMMSDYQDIGNGWLRLLLFDTVTGILDVRTYSPFLNDFMTDADNKFTYDAKISQRFVPDTTDKLLRSQVISTFDTGLDSWRQVGDSNSTLVWKSDANGKGYLYLTDGASGTEDYFAAPAKFRGDLSQYDAITLDYRVFTANADPDPIHIRLYSDSQYYDWVNTERVLNDGTWKRLVASLKDSDLWVAGGGATEAFSSFITHITGVRVFADIVSGTEQNGMDNFALARYEVMTRAVASSTFDSGRESWTTDADGEVSWDSFGAVNGTDLSTGGTWYFCAPSKFVGNKSQCYRGTLEFDLKQQKVDSQSDQDDIVLSGGGLTIAKNLPVASNPDATWTHYTFRLDETSGWINKATGLAPSAAQFAAVMSSLASLRIRGEYRAGADEAWLDNVVLTQSDTVDVQSITEARALADGTMVNITGEFVATAASTTFTDGGYYVEAPDRSAAIKIVPATGLQSVAIGDKITGSGTISTDANGERYIALTSVSRTPTVRIRSLMLTHEAVMEGLEPRGLLVTVSGRLVNIDPALQPTYAYVDDGSAVMTGAQRGVKIVLNGLNTPVSKDLNCDGILVTGILTLARDADGTIIPVIRPRSNTDIVTLSVP